MKHLFYSLILLGDNRFTITERIIGWLKLLLAFSPVAYVLNMFNLWFADNKKFVTLFIIVLFINAVFGLWKHHREKEFSWEEFLKKTGIMIIVVISVYFLLNALQSVAGDNFISDGFNVMIQVTTIFFPASKALKSIYIISNGEYPPKFIMEKLYNFEKDGDVKELLKTPKKE
jgi:hypothetical protein